MTRNTHRFYFSTICCFLFFFASCEEKENVDSVKNSIVGTWQLTSVKIDGTDADLSSFPTTFLQFQSTAIFQAYNPSSGEKTRGGWSYEGDMLNISVYLPVAYYVEKVDAQNLSLKRLDFNLDGNPKTTLQDYRRSADSEIP